MAFPESPCYICEQPITKLEEGTVACSDFAKDLEMMLNSNKGDAVALVSGKHGRFVNVVTLQYFEQDHERFHQPPEKGVYQVREMMREELANHKAHVYRLHEVLEQKPDKFLYLLAHMACIPEDARGPGFYDIELERINTPAKGIEWTIHLSEKVWWNPTAGCRCSTAFLDDKTRFHKRWREQPF